LRRKALLWCTGLSALMLVATGTALWLGAPSKQTGSEERPDKPEGRMADRSAMNPSVRRIAVIAAMPSELEPFVKKAGSLTRETLGDRPLYRGRIGEAEVVATRTGMGTDFATQVTDRLLDAYDIDHVIAIGIAGGVTGVEIGDVLTPALVINGDDGTERVPTTPRGITPRGKLRTSNTFSVDKALMDRLAREGVNAVDMETAAIGASAERHGCSWSVYRAISDKASDDLISAEIFGLAHPDGSPNLWAALRFIARRPWVLPGLIRLGRDAQIAADAAADAALRELRGG
jgi:adenosylhomocysteine nucleosidase